MSILCLLFMLDAGTRPICATRKFWFVRKSTSKGKVQLDWVFWPRKESTLRTHRDLFWCPFCIMKSDGYHWSCCIEPLRLNHVSAFLWRDHCIAMLQVTSEIKWFKLWGESYVQIIASVRLLRSTRTKKTSHMQWTILEWSSPAGSI